MLQPYKSKTWARCSDGFFCLSASFKAVGETAMIIEKAAIAFLGDEVLSDIGHRSYLTLLRTTLHKLNFYVIK